MRAKELRLALVCYGGISLAVYMHGVTKEIWKLARASTLGPVDAASLRPSERIYADVLDRMAQRSGVRLSVLPDIVAGASAGGLNGMFLAQAILTGQSFEPLTRLWLDRADIDRLLVPEESGWTGFAKQWVAPLVRMLITRSSTRDDSRAIEREVREKLTRFVRSRWFEAPFSGIGFSRLIAEALDEMANGGGGMPLLPHSHPLDLFTTATDYTGHTQRLALHSPPWVEEREHRVQISFRASTGTGHLAPLPELVFAARATASFPGAFPPLQLAEIDQLMAERAEAWPSRAAFLARILPEHAAAGTLEDAALMDGSILVNAPFGQAIAALPARPAENEVDRRIVYIDPTQRSERQNTPSKPGFFNVIFRALSTIPREQPIRDNLEALAEQSADLARARKIMARLQPGVEASVARALGKAVLHARPDARLLGHWRHAAQDAAAQEAGFAYHAYALVKLESTLDAVTAELATATPSLDATALRQALGRWASANLRLSPLQGTGLSSEMVAFLRAHDGAYRQRRVRHVIRRLDEVTDHDVARKAAWRALSLTLEPRAVAPAPHAQRAPGPALRAVAASADYEKLDDQIDAIIAQAVAELPEDLAQVLLLAYLGFAFYDAATLALTRGNGLAETNPVKIDRISPLDAQDSAGLNRRLKGEEFHNFAAFFSRAYREHDYLLGRLHGAARMVDLLASTGSGLNEEAEIALLKHQLFTAILDEEAPLLTADPALIATIRRKIGEGGPN